MGIYRDGQTERHKKKLLELLRYLKNKHENDLIFFLNIAGSMTQLKHQNQKIEQVTPITRHLKNMRYEASSCAYQPATPY